MATTPAKKAPAKKAAPRKAAAKSVVKAVEEPVDDTSRTDAVLGVAQVVDTVDTLADIPEELQFSTDSGSRRTPESLTIAIDGMQCTLHQPSDALMILLMASFTPEADAATKLRAMLDLVNACLNEQGRFILRRMMFATDNSFDDAILGQLTAVVLQRWSDGSDNVDLTVKKKREPQNRASRRQAARG